MKKSVQVSLLSAVLLLSAIATAQAETVIRTERVQITVSDSGDIQMRTDGRPAVGRQGMTPANTYRSTAQLNRLLGCYRQQRHHAYHANSQAGDRVVSQSQSSTVLCR